jgi:hypothetical protein
MSNHSRRAVLAGIAAAPALAAPALALSDTTADADLLALKPDLELIIRDYAAPQAADDWVEVDPDLKRWSELHDRMHPLVDSIMSHRPKTLAGLGVIIRAASLSYDDYDRETTVKAGKATLSLRSAHFAVSSPSRTTKTTRPCHDGQAQNRHKSQAHEERLRPRTLSFIASWAKPTAIRRAISATF